MYAKKRLMKPVCAGVIFVLVSVSLAPSIYADNSEWMVSEDFVKYTVEFCGLKNCQPFTVNLSESDAAEVELLFDVFKNKVDNSTSWEETFQLYSDLISDLDGFGLLGDKSKEAIYELIFNIYSSSKTFDKIPNQKNLLVDDTELVEEDEITNYFCLVAGEAETIWILPRSLYLLQELTVNTFGKFWSPIVNFLWSLEIPFLGWPLLTIAGLITVMNFIVFCVLLSGFWYTFNYDLCHGLFDLIPYPRVVGFGAEYPNVYGDPYNKSAVGWIHSIGLNGIQKYNENTSFYGQIDSPFTVGTRLCYTGMFGFRGISLGTVYEMKLIGVTPILKLGPDPP